MIRNRTMLLLLGLLVACVPEEGAGKPKGIAARVPGDALALLTWCGGDQALTVSEDTAFGKTLAEPQVAAFLRQLGQKIDDFVRLHTSEQISPEAYGQLRGLVLEALKHPGVLAVNRVGMAEQALQLEVVLSFELGDRAAGFTRQLEAGLQADGSVPQPQAVMLGGKPAKRISVPRIGEVYFGAFDGQFVLGLGRDGIERFIDPPSDSRGTLADNADYKLARRKVGGPDEARLLALHVNLVKVRDLVEQVTLGREGEEAAKRFRTLVSAMGLDKLVSLSWEFYSHKAGFRNSLFVRTSGPPSGLLALGNAEPISPQDLEWIPQEPYWAAVFPLDAGALYDFLLQNIEASEDDLRRDAMARIEKIEASLGLKLDVDFLDLIVGKCVTFDALENGGIWLTGVALIIETPDVRRLSVALEMLVAAIAGKLRGLGLSAVRTEYRERVIHHVGVAGAPFPLTPAWAEVDGYIVLGLYVQTIKAVIDRRLNPQRDIQSLGVNADFITAQEELSGLGYSMVYVDSKTAVRTLHSRSLPAADPATSQAMAQNLFGHVGVAHRGDDGVLFSSYGPLPFGVPAFGEAPALISVAYASTVMLPSLRRARLQARRVVSRANLSGIAKACVVYASRHDGEFPPDLQTLKESVNIDERSFRSPLAKAGEEASYVYYPGCRIEEARKYEYPTTIIAHERRELGVDGGVDVVFADCHVEFVSLADLDHRLQISERQKNRKPIE